jgi:hypothetical protein
MSRLLREVLIVIILLIEPIVTMFIITQEIIIYFVRIKVILTSLT